MRAFSISSADASFSFVVSGRSGQKRDPGRAGRARSYSGNERDRCGGCLFRQKRLFKEERNAATGIEEVLIGCFGLIAGLEDRSMTFMVEFTGEPSGLFYDCVAFRFSVESFQYESVFFELIRSCPISEIKKTLKLTHQTSCTGDWPDA